MSLFTLQFISTLHLSVSTTSQAYCNLYLSTAVYIYCMRIYIYMHIYLIYLLQRVLPQCISVYLLHEYLIYLLHCVPTAVHIYCGVYLSTAVHVYLLRCMSTACISIADMWRLAELHRGRSGLLG